MTKVMILGINGFTGRCFSQYIIDKSLANKFSFLGIDINHGEQYPGIEYLNIDFSTYSNIENVLIENQPDYIINLIGMFNSENIERLIEINANISMKIFEVIKNMKLNIKKVLLIGTAAEYGKSSELPLNENSQLNPVNFYGLSKVIQSRYMLYYIRNYGLNIDLARTFNVTGCGLSANLSIASFVNQCRKAKDGDSIFVGNLKTQRDFLDIYDVIDAYWKILMLPESGEVYNVCSGHSYAIIELLNYLIKISGKNINVKIRNDLIKKADIDDSYGSNRKLVQATGWGPKKDIFKSLDEMYFI